MSMEITGDKLQVTGDKPPGGYLDVPGARSFQMSEETFRLVSALLLISDWITKGV